MDDDIEDEVFHQTMWAHMKILSKFLLNIPLNNTISYVGRHVRSAFFKPETLALGLVLVAVVFLCHSAEFWYKTIVSKLALLTSKRDGFRLFVGTGTSGERQSWELRQKDVGVYALQGRRPRMEDRFSVLEDENIGVTLYGVYDGHGGETAAEFVEKNLFRTLLKRLHDVSQISNKDSSSSPEQKKPQMGDSAASSSKDSSFSASSSHFNLTGVLSQFLTEEILATDKELLTLVKAMNDVAGTTALVALVHNEELIVANVGDSRGVICDSKGTAVPLSFDHKPQQLKEHRRIKEAGGFITFNGVWRVAGILATSRALGDFPLKDRNLVIAEPDILTFNLNDLQPQFMILATDGLWDAFTNEEAIAYIREHLDEPHLGAKSIAMQAYYRGSLDNITVVVVEFRNFMASRVSLSSEE